MNALLSSDETPHDVTSAEALINKHSEHQLEMSLHATNIADFIETGKKLIDEDHFLSKDVSCLAFTDKCFFFSCDKRNRYRSQKCLSSWTFIYIWILNMTDN